MDDLSRVPLGADCVGYVSRSFVDILSDSPGTVALILLFVVGFGIFAASERAGHAEDWKCRIVGGLHGLLHVALVVTLMWAFAHWSLSRLPLTSEHVHVQSVPILGYVPTAALVVFFVVAMGTVGGLLGGTLVGFYFILTHFMPGLRLHTQEVFSSQSIPDYKNFLRLHVDVDGDLTIYPIGIPVVCKRWSFVPKGAADEPWWRPGRRISWRLIDRPIRCPSPARRPAAE